MMRKARFFVILSLIVVCKTTPGRLAKRQHDSTGEKIHDIDKGNPTKKEEPCGLHTFHGTWDSLGLSDILVAPRLPIKFAFCYGSCAPPYSLDARVRNYNTYDVLLRQMANLKNAPLSDDKKRKFKTACCVPVAFTGLQVTRKTKETTQREYWSNAIPSKCGCR